VALIEALIARPDGALGPERLVALEQRCAGAAALLVGPDWWSPRRRGCSRAYWSLMRRRWPGWRKRSAVGWAVHLYGRAADQVARAIGSPGCLSRERLDCLPSLLTGVALTIGAGRADMRSACHETCLEESRLEHAGNADTRPRRYARGPAAVRRGPCASSAGCLAPSRRAPDKSDRSHYGKFGRVVAVFGELAAGRAPATCCLRTGGGPVHQPPRHSTCPGRARKTAIEHAPDSHGLPGAWLHEWRHAPVDCWPPARRRAALLTTQHRRPPPPSAGCTFPAWARKW
jgi:hypothetical protein